MMSRDIKRINIKENVKKYMNTYVFLLCILMSIAIVFNNKFNMGDELWNFANIYKMDKGYIIYKDLNVIITPLFFYIGQLIFKVFGTNFFNFRIYNLFIITLFLFTIYNFFTAFKSKKLNALVYTILLYGIIKQMATAGGANYNNLAITFYILGIYFNLRINQKNKFLPFLQGIISFITFMTKQNIGIYYLIASFFMHLLIAIKYKNVKKEALKYAKELFTFFVLITIFALMLHLQGNLYNFIDFCFLGLNEFSFHNYSLGSYTIYMIILSLLSIWYSIFVIKQKKDDNQVMNNIIVLPFIIMNLPMMYPIFNEYHIWLATLIGIITILANLDLTVINEFLEDKKLFKYIITIFIIFIIPYAIFNVYQYIKNFDSIFDVYKGAVISKEQETHINKIKNYIKENNGNGKDVKVLSYKANAYMILFNKNNKTMDLPFYGNLGYRGEQGLIEDLSKLKDVKVLIDKEDNYLGQEAKGAIQYIKDNYTYECEIEDFYIYSK